MSALSLCTLHCVRWTISAIVCKYRKKQGQHFGQLSKSLYLFKTCCKKKITFCFRNTFIYTYKGGNEQKLRTTGFFSNIQIL